MYTLMSAISPWASVYFLLIVAIGGAHTHRSAALRRTSARRLHAHTVVAAITRLAHTSVDARTRRARIRILRAVRIATPGASPLVRARGRRCVHSHPLLHTLSTGFFIINLFLAVIFEELVSAEAFEMAIERSSFAGAGVLAPATARTARTSRTTVNHTTRRGSSFVPPERWGSWRKCLAAAVQSDAFNYVSTALVGVNMVLMCLVYDGMPVRHTTIRAERRATAVLCRC
jgi:hypothetical protein